jgi:hypothetical protein
MASVLSSPNRVVWEYFFSLRQLSSQAREAPSPEMARQAAALAVVMAVTVVEVFLNLWFRVRVEEQGIEVNRQSFLADLERRASLEQKLRRWPARYLGTALDLNSGPGAQFSELKKLRNSIIHFISSHQSFEAEGFAIHGLADTSQYDALDSASAVWAHETAENTVAEVFRLAGLADIRGALHAWTGRIAV